MNDEVDRLAKLALVSPQSGFPDARQSAFFSALPSYRHQPIDKNLFHFLKDLYQSQFFGSFLTAGRFRTKARLHELRLIDWPATWSALAYMKTPFGVQGTTFSTSQFRTFKVKMMLDLLPVLELLKLRRPDLYPASLSCMECSAPTCSDSTCLESWDHLWNCPKRAHLVTKIIAQAKQSLFKAIRKRSPDAPLHGVSHNSCWLFHHFGTEVGAFDFMAGFVPTSLVTHISELVGSLATARELIDKSLYKLHKQFYALIWKPRCSLIQTFKEPWGITPALERASLTPGFSPYTPSIALPHRTSVYTQSSYQNWLLSYMRYGNSWQDFHISLNR